MKAVFEWSASDKLLREELVATGVAGKVNRYVEIEHAQLDTDTRRRIVALAGSISSDPIRIRSNEAIKPDAVASARARGDNGLSRISLYFDQQPTVEEALVAAETCTADMAAVRAADREYRAEQERIAGEKAAARAAAKVEIDKLMAAGDLAGLWTFAMPGANSDDIRDAIKSVQNARFEAERETWTAAHGSAHLRRCRDAGYDCLRLYATERAALEAPGFVVDFGDKAEWSARSCPSAAAMDAVDEARAGGLSDPTVVWLKSPPQARADPWQDDEFEPCEAVVVRKWLYRYDLVKIVA